jgi:hypothetical protein
VNGDGDARRRQIQHVVDLLPSIHAGIAPPR